MRASITTCIWSGHRLLDRTCMRVNEMMPGSRSSRRFSPSSIAQNRSKAVESRLEHCDSRSTLILQSRRMDVLRP